MVDEYILGLHGVANEYADRIMAVLEAVKQELVKAGLEVNGPEDISGDEYTWSLCAKAPGAGPESLVDVAVTICESREYQGDDEGINFQIRVEAHKDGESTILGECVPFNFTPDLWVPLDKPEAIEARFTLIKEIPTTETAKLVLDYLMPHRRRPEEDEVDDDEADDDEADDDEADNDMELGSFAPGAERLIMQAVALAETERQQRLSKTGDISASEPQIPKEQDAEPTMVIFRRYRTGAKEILALFPEVDAGHGLCSSYIHVGQHGAAEYTYVVGLTTLAKLTDPDVIELKTELESLGYRLVVRRRRSYR